MSTIARFHRIDDVHIAGARQNAAATRALLNETESLDIDKSWQGIHFMLTGELEGGPWPFYDVIFGGEELPLETGYGRVRAHSADAVRELATALHQLSVEDFSKRFDAPALARAKAYPEIWDQPHAREYVIKYYAALRNYYWDAAQHGQGVVLYLT